MTLERARTRWLARKRAGKQPIDIASRLGGGAEPCAICQKPVYIAERVTIEHVQKKAQTKKRTAYHQECFRCHACGVKLFMSRWTRDDAGKLCCALHSKSHFAPPPRVPPPTEQGAPPPTTPSQPPTLSHPHTAPRHLSNMQNTPPPPPTPPPRLAPRLLSNMQSSPQMALPPPPPSCPPPQPEVEKRKTRAVPFGARLSSGQTEPTRSPRRTELTHSPRRTESTRSRTVSRLTSLWESKVVPPAGSHQRKKATRPVLPSTHEEDSSESKAADARDVVAIRISPPTHGAKPLVAVKRVTLADEAGQLKVLELDVSSTPPKGAPSPPPSFSHAEDVGSSEASAPPRLSQCSEHSRGSTIKWAMDQKLAMCAGTDSSAEKTNGCSSDSHTPATTANSRRGRHSYVQTEYDLAITDALNAASGVSNAA